MAPAAPTGTPAGGFAPVDLAAMRDYPLCAARLQAATRLGLAPGIQACNRGLAAWPGGATSGQPCPAKHC